MDKVPKKKNEYRFTECLSNGNYVHVFFVRRRVSNDSISFQWYVSVFLSPGNDYKRAKRWFNGNGKKVNITGDGSLEGLRRALQYIMSFKDTLKINEELIIQWSDLKRSRAYRWLGRYGFTNYVDCDGNIVGYGIRNPRYWEFIEDPEEVGAM